MKVSLLTDAPKHNLALMKLSAWHKANGDDVLLNMPLWKSDISYASILFEKNKKLFNADTYGGPAFIGVRLGSKIEGMKPDYDLYPDIDFSLGFTWSYCPRQCSFCKVPKQNNPKEHKSIWSFHDSKFRKICLLNNNTFSDPYWIDTFEEIWDADLTVVDENGYDLRLMDEPRAKALKKTKFQGKIHFAWDKMGDEKSILRGLALIRKYKIHGHIYVLIGYDTTEEEDLYRCQKLVDFGQDPYIMPYKRTDHNKRFKRFFDTFMWRKYKTIKEAWDNYR